MYRYYNANPEDEKIGDCVVRAISTALDKDYYEILYQLFNISNYFNCDMIVKDCYDILLTKGYNLLKYGGLSRRVEQVAEDFNDKNVIMRIHGHLTCSKKGIVYDTWNTSNEIVDIFWVVD